MKYIANITLSTRSKFFPALALNMLKGSPERLKKPLNRANANNINISGQFNGTCYTLSFLFIFLFLPTIIIADELSKKYDEQVQEMEKEGYNLIDSFFEQAHISIANKQDIMTLEWFEINSENKEKLENILSDAFLLFKCDQNRENPIPKLLSTYVETKMHEEIPKIFDIYGVSTKRIDDFYQFSCVLCELSQGINCDKMKRRAKSEHFHCMLKLEIQKRARKQLRKDQAHELRQLLMMGAQR